MKGDGWWDYAAEIVVKAIKKGGFENDLEATTAAMALIYAEWEKGLPLMSNTQFAVAAYLFREVPNRLAPFAWRMVVNGLSGYWRWEEHDDKKRVFSITAALKNLGILSVKEAKDVSSFNSIEIETAYEPCFVIDEYFLARIVKKFNLPTLNQSIGGKKTLSREEISLREQYQNGIKCVTQGFINQNMYLKAVQSV